MIAVMHKAAPELSLRRRCDLTGTGRTGDSTHPAPDASAARATALRDAIEQLVLEFPGDGDRRVTKALHRAGWNVNHKRVVRVMRQASLLCQLKRHFVVTTRRDPRLPAYPNLLADVTLRSREQAWVADLTSIHLPTTFVDRACLLDAWSRRCLGWHLSRQIDTTLPLTALERALGTRQPTAGVIHHSDRGVQDARAAYVARLTDAHARSSMSAVGNPYDNAKAERLFKPLKREEVYLHHDDSVAEAAANLGHLIEDVDNQKRLHSSLGYRPPTEVEALLTDSAQS